MAESYEDLLIGLLNEKKELFQKVLECAEEQAVLTYSEQAAEYDSLLGQRECYINSIKKNETIYNRYLGNPAYQLSENIDQKVAELNKEIVELVSRITMLDKQNRQKLAFEFEDVKNKLKKVRLGKKGRKIYTDNKLNFAGAYTDSRR